MGSLKPPVLSVSEALEIAAKSQPQSATIRADADSSGLKSGTEVIVMADDTGRDPVRGTLVAADAQELVIRASHPRVGAIAIHFPRVGFDVVAA